MPIIPCARRLRSCDARDRELARRAAGVVADTIVCEYNDADGVAAAVERYGEGLAAIFVEPVAGNMGCVPPAPGFLEALRLLCDAAGALLVFDEVITGFRVARGGAQERFGVTPDLTVLGKIVGGGCRSLLRRPRRRDGAPRARRATSTRRARSRQSAHDRGRPLGPAPAARPGRVRRARAPRARLEAGSRRSAACSASAPCSRSSRAPRPVDGSRRLTRRLRCALPPPARPRYLRRAEPVRVPVPVARAR